MIIEQAPKKCDRKWHTCFTVHAMHTKKEMNEQMSGKMVIVCEIFCCCEVHFFFPFPLKCKSAVSLNLLSLFDWFLCFFLLAVFRIVRLQKTVSIRSHKKKREQWKFEEEIPRPIFGLTVRSLRTKTVFWIRVKKTPLTMQK